MAAELTDDEFDARERRLKADFEDARKAANLARANLDRIGNELRELRIACRDAQEQRS